MNYQQMGQQIIAGVVVGVLVVGITTFLRNRQIVPPPVAKNDDYTNLWGALS
ncbi:hypothetical protein P8629_07045 [Hydrogenovibrio sp. 3SP14C1]|uniref:hypothetical protein n=1 Tax=Hydrogenovibrio sp. 3SP14C1 TaxID=3038774 RepID=UPI0024180934|nr:hypothetical protein [Hydrogenovibrio sp. 3SP14C1]MDG4812762.1 hypothetical protein [Hydrogenovibrio sp. 3SP14C1]